MEIRLVAVDLDGTLLKNDKSLSVKTARSVAHAAACGLEIVIATGRTYREFSFLLDRLPAIRYAVTCTGACVMDCRTQRELACTPLDAGILRSAWDLLRPFDVLFEVFQDGAIYVDADKLPRLDWYMEASRNPGLPGTRSGRAMFGQWLNSQTRPVSKVHMFFRTTAERNAAWDALRGMDAFLCCSDAVDLEIMAQGVDKGTGLAQLARYLGLERSQIMAVGDSGNDLGMLQYAGVAAVMANGGDALRSLADVVAGSNEQDGVAGLLDDLTENRLVLPLDKQPGEPSHTARPVAAGCE